MPFIPSPDNDQTGIAIQSKTGTVPFDGSLFLQLEEQKERRKANALQQQQHIAQQKAKRDEEISADIAQQIEKAGRSGKPAMKDIESGLVAEKQMAISDYVTKNSKELHSEDPSVRAKAVVGFQNEVNKFNQWVNLSSQWQKQQLINGAPMGKAITDKEASPDDYYNYSDWASMNDVSTAGKYDLVVPQKKASWTKLVSEDMQKDADTWIGNNPDKPYTEEQAKEHLRWHIRDDSQGYGLRATHDLGKLKEKDPTKYNEYVKKFGDKAAEEYAVDSNLAGLKYSLGVRLKPTIPQWQSGPAQIKNNPVNIGYTNENEIVIEPNDKSVVVKDTKGDPINSNQFKVKFNDDGQPIQVKAKITYSKEDYIAKNKWYEWRKAEKEWQKRVKADMDAARKESTSPEKFAEKEAEIIDYFATIDPLKPKPSEREPIHDNGETIVYTSKDDIATILNQVPIKSTEGLTGKAKANYTNQRPKGEKKTEKSPTIIKYKVGNKSFAIPSTDEAEFLKDNPKAQKQ